MYYSRVGREVIRVKGYRNEMCVVEEVTCDRLQFRRDKNLAAQRMWHRKILLW